ncbi:unnamed protein product [Pleuronectes platessa]|uniref:Uncharacterized protein n=1 Tax=Pleuronectes platessa TaxID=8262 RepID=A0A9N7Y717_PLEPL|nr:unnamed protein product [Pleuronectes platessa]
MNTDPEPFCRESQTVSVLSRNQASGLLVVENVFPEDVGTDDLSLSSVDRLLLLPHLRHGGAEGQTTTSPMGLSAPVGTGIIRARPAPPKQFQQQLKAGFSQDVETQRHVFCLFCLFCLFCPCWTQTAHRGGSGAQRPTN